MKKLAVILLLVATAGGLALATSASAHPLGNFTINRYSRIEPSGNRLYVLYVLDLAEIPTFQARPQVAAEADALRDPARPDDRAAPRAHRRRPPLACSPRSARCSPSRRARRACARRGSRSCSAARELAGTSRVAYRDANYAGRIGWKEITVSRGGRAAPPSRVPQVAARSSSPTRRTSSQSPLDVVSARVDVEPGRPPARRPASSHATCSSSAQACGRSPTEASRA